MTFFKVLAPVNPPPKRSLSTCTSESIVGVFGVSSSSRAGVAVESTASTFVTIASTLAAKPHEGQSTYVSSPVGHGAKNSSDFEPPIAPETALTMLYLRPRRSKVLTYASRCFWYEISRPASSTSNE